jgi:uncharacterized membrane protein (UPF0136 family)
MYGIAIAIGAGYGVLSLVGGIMGYVKAKSRASLIAGGISGLLLIGGAVLAASNPVVGLSIVAVISAALVGRFAKSALRKGSSPVAYVMVGGGLLALVTAGLALI